MADTKHPLNAAVVEELRMAFAGRHVPHVHELAENVLRVVADYMEQEDAKPLPPGVVTAEIRARVWPGVDTTEVRLQLGAALGKLLESFKQGGTLHPDIGYSVGTRSGPPEDTPEQTPEPEVVADGVKIYRVVSEDPDTLRWRVELDLAERVGGKGQQP